MNLLELANSVMDHGDMLKTVTCLSQTHHSDTPIERVHKMYVDVLRELIESTPTDKYLDHQLHVSNVIDEDAEEQYVNVNLVRGEDTWAIDFVDWGDLLMCEVVDDIGMDTSNLLAHILWELTFWGWTNSDVQEQAGTLLDSLSD